MLSKTRSRLSNRWKGSIHPPNSGKLISHFLNKKLFYFISIDRDHGVVRNRACAKLQIGNLIFKGAGYNFQTAKKAASTYALKYYDVRVTIKINKTNAL
jgi:hypothetical protein